ncbi:hypothetical protein HYH03_011229 [Edaphochlamys debaryana]|uniref:Guanylate cyclase domain-containing protein n=1 Tax=Edaphochlamys debaryana TaxID=47281 RepID=A0A835XSA7_9CHLO|nr:hypothetical protein HYH03_011229 [Edaphochlamys debaryana]|eukprot:KAG2490277.1 hypothetical protein HYH03_011229 [Edaphochlamys debaryana]
MGPDAAAQLERLAVTGAVQPVPPQTLRGVSAAAGFPAVTLDVMPCLFDPQSLDGSSHAPTGKRGLGSFLSCLRPAVQGRSAPTGSGTAAGGASAPLGTVLVVLSLQPRAGALEASAVVPPSDSAKTASQCGPLTATASSGTEGRPWAAALQLLDLAWEGLPACVTVFTAEGAVAFQNAASRTYMGSRIITPSTQDTGLSLEHSLSSGGQEDCDGSSNSGRGMLSRLFALDPSKLEQLLEATQLLGRRTARGAWEGIVRVPASLNPEGPPLTGTDSSPQHSGEEGVLTAAGPPTGRVARAAESLLGEPRPGAPSLAAAGHGSDTACGTGCLEPSGWTTLQRSGSVLGRGQGFSANPTHSVSHRPLSSSSSSSSNSRSDQEARGSGLMGSLLGVDVETVRVAELFISNGGTPRQESFRRQQSSKRFTSAAPMATSTWALMLPDLDACSTTTPISVGRQPSVSALTRPRGVLGPPPLSKAVSDNVAGLASACTRDGHSMSSALASAATAAATTTAVDVRSGDDASSELLHTDRLGPLPSHLASAARASVTLRGSKSFTLGRRATAPQDSPTEAFAQPRRPLLDATPGSSMSRSRSQTALNALDPPPPDELGAPATAANARSAARRHSVLSLLAVGSREHAADSGGSTHSGAPRLLQFASSLVNAPTASGMEGSRLTSRPSRKALALRTGSGSVAAGGEATGEDEDPGLSSAANMVARLRTYSFRAPAVPGAADRARLAALASPTEHPRQVSLRAATGKGEAEEQGPTQQQQQPEAEAGVAAAEARAGPETGRAWHEVCAAAVEDPDSGARYLVVMQRDVTAKVEAERHIAQVSEMEHRLLEQVFPRHVLAYMTEEGCQPAPVPEDEGPSDGDAAPPTPTWRPQVRDYTRLATWHPQVTILFADIQGFTPMCKQLPACVVMKFLNDLFVRFDSLLDVHGVYKVETIGDCYVVAGGLIAEDADGMAAVQGGGVSDPRQANQVFSFAQAMLHAAAAVTLPTTGEPVRIRVGIHSGPVVSGVVGTRMPRFCLFGDTVNTASRMESTSQAGAIHASSDTFVLLSPDQRQGWAPTGGIEVKGKGRMDTFLWGDAVAVAVE